MPTCPRCRSTDLVAFTLSPAGEPLHFALCRSCEHRWWLSEERAIGLCDVLAEIGAAATR